LRIANLMRYRLSFVSRFGIRFRIVNPQSAIRNPQFCCCSFLRCSSQRISLVHWHHLLLTSNFRSQIQITFFPNDMYCVTKLMKAERDTAANTLRGTLLLRTAISRTLAKHRDHHPLKAPCLHLAIQILRLSKNVKERASSLPGKLPAPNNSRDFSLRFGSGSPLPLNQNVL
jgi:hypothetical protein